jgi:protoheme IX farnesyltransferase
VIARTRAQTAQPASTWAALRDLVDLTKPGITSLVLCTTAGGLYLAPGRVDRLRALVVVLTTGAVVSAANALNQYLERDIDGFMERTRDRPLPAHRLDARVALGFGLALAALSVPLLWLAGGWMTGVLALIALGSYVAVYTPMKQWTPLALFVGAVPGAIPPLIGWTTVTARPGAGGLALFAILFFWQIPHFMAIALYRKADYARAGLKVFSVVHGDATTRRHILAWSVVLWAVTLVPWLLGTTGLAYGLLALALGAIFVAQAVVLLLRQSPLAARRLFLGSILHLTVLFVALMLGARG